MDLPLPFTDQLLLLSASSMKPLQLQSSDLSNHFQQIIGEQFGKEAPLEFEKNILPRADCSLKVHDPDEFTYSYNLRLIPDSFLDKYCNLFSIDKKRKKVLRLLFQEFILRTFMDIYGENPKKRNQWYPTRQKNKNA